MSDGSSKGWTPTDFDSSLPYQSNGIWSEEDTKLVENIPDEVEYFNVYGTDEEQESQRQADRQARAGGQDPAERWRPNERSTDLWKISGDRDFVTVYHHRAELGLLSPGKFRNERYTACSQVGTGREVAFADNWRLRGETDPGIGYWVGKTILVFQGKELPWEAYPSEEEYEPGEPEGDVEGEESEEFEETPSTMYVSSSAQACEGERSRSRSRSRRSGGSDHGEREAEDYVEILISLGDATANEWAKVLKAGNDLLDKAGSVEPAARLL